MNALQKERSRVWMEAFKLAIMAEAQGLKISDDDTYSAYADKVLNAWDKRFNNENT